MLPTIKSFLKKLFSDEGGVSSKRVVGFGAFLLIVEIVQVALFGGKTIAEFIFWGILGLIFACFSLNAMIDMKALSSKTKVASDVAKEGDTQTAQELLTNDKP